VNFTVDKVASLDNLTSGLTLGDGYGVYGLEDYMKAEDLSTANRLFGLLD
jgi:hypothetical protein